MPSLQLITKTYLSTHLSINMPTSNIPTSVDHPFINLPAQLYKKKIRLTTKTYLSTHLVVCLYTYVPTDLSVQQPTCSFKCFLFRITTKTNMSTNLLVCIPIYLYPFINLHFHFDLFFPANHEGVTIHSPAGRLVHRPTRSSSYLFILTFPSG